MWVFAILREANFGVDSSESAYSPICAEYFHTTTGSLLVSRVGRAISSNHYYSTVRNVCIVGNKNVLVENLRDIESLNFHLLVAVSRHSFVTARNQQIPCIAAK